jgi:hypothetical protein
VAPNLSLINPVHNSFAFSFILQVLLRLKIGFVRSEFPPKVLYASLFPSVRVTYIDLVILTLTGEQLNTYFSPALCYIPPITYKHFFQQTVLKQTA